MDVRVDGFFPFFIYRTWIAHDLQPHNLLVLPVSRHPSDICKSHFDGNRHGRLGAALKP